MFVKKKVLWIICFTILFGLTFAYFATRNYLKTQIMLEDNDDVHNYICDYIENHIFSFWSRSDFRTICEYRLLGFDAQYIYIYAKGEDFQPSKTDNEKLFRTNASLAEIRLTYKHQNGSLVITEAATPKEGENYSEQLVQLFPDAVRNRIYINEENAILDELVIKRAFHVFDLPYNPANCLDY